METNLMYNRHNVCRACMKESSDTRALFDDKCFLCTSLGEMLSYVTGIEFNYEDELPRQICGSCDTMARQFHAFKRLCKESENHFRTLMIPHENQSDFNTNVCVKIENDGNGSLSQKTVDHSDNKDRIGQGVTVFSEHCLEAKIEVLDVNSRLHDETKCSMAQSILNPANQNGKDEDDVKEEIDDSIDYFSDDILNIPEDNDSRFVVNVKNERCDTEASAGVKKSTKKLSKIRDKPSNNLVCSCCNIAHKTIKAYSSHLGKKNSVQPESRERIHQCSHCMRKFARKNTLAIHLKKHEKQLKKHTCTVCKREFIHRAHLDNHILSVHSKPEGFACDSCNKSFPTEDSLSLHKDVHKSQKRHQCKHCTKAFSMLSTLRDHLRVHTGEKPYLCPTCGKGFTQNTNLIDHIRRHEGIKPYRCEMCDQRFVSKGELSAHSRKHSGAHPFVCDDCGNGFTTSSSLVKHRRTHTGERPYACDLCPMRFAASGTLKNHRRTHTGEKPYKCTHCEKAFVQKNDLVSHTRCHTGERPYVCSTCGQAFRQGSALKTHLKMHSVKEVHPLHRKEGPMENS